MLDPPCPGLVPISHLTGHDPADTALLREMAAEAHRYLESFSSCIAVLESYFAKGVGGIFAVFLFRVLTRSADDGDWMWVLVGDLPAIYLHFEFAATPDKAFAEYVAGITRWIAYARSSQLDPPEDVPPISTPATPEWADKLEHRLKSLVEILGSEFSYQP